MTLTVWAYANKSRRYLAAYTVRTSDLEGLLADIRDLVEKRMMRPRGEE